jgi:hypothetical protein
VRSTFSPLIDYIITETLSTLRFDLNRQQYLLSVRCRFYSDNNTADDFINWIMPYVDADEGQFLGLWEDDAYGGMPREIYASACI